MDEDELVSSFQLLTDNQKDVEQTNKQIMFRRRKRECKPNYVTLIYFLKFWITNLHK